MTETRNITINAYDSSWIGHVSITLGSITYEQQWDQSSYGGLFTGTAGPNDGLIRPRPDPGEPDPLNNNKPAIGPSVSITYTVPSANYQAALDYINSNLGKNNYGLITQNCVIFVDNVAKAAGLSTYDWRYEIARQGGIPGSHPIETIISLPSPDLSLWEAEGLPVPPWCFPAHTPITISLTETRPISEIRVGDMVLAFDPAADLGRGALVPRRVVRLYRNTTEEWVKLTWVDGGEAKELIATPGHHFLDRFGNFPTIEEMLENGKATVVLASGELTEVTAERIVYSAETAHLFEQAQAVGMVAGNAALKHAAVDGWQTYNFEVEDLHTYVAGGVRVHNSSDDQGVIEDSIHPAYMQAGDKATDSWTALLQTVGDNVVAGVVGQMPSLAGAFGFETESTKLESSRDEVVATRVNKDSSITFVTKADHSQVVTETTFVRTSGGTYTPVSVHDVSVADGGYSSTGNDWGNHWADPRTNVQRVLNDDSESSSSSDSSSDRSDSSSSSSGSSSSGSSSSGSHAYGGYSYGGYGAGGYSYGGSSGNSSYGGSSSGGTRTGGTSTGGTNTGYTNTGNNPGNPNAPTYYGGGTTTTPRSTGSTSVSTDPNRVGPQPIILDLEGDGVQIEEMDSSSIFVDATGNGLLHRSAWAAAGDAVLFYDPDGRNALTEQRQYVFTEWAPEASSDMDALRTAFDANADGKLTSADAEFSKFKLLVTNPDGSTTVQTLAYFGITELSLKEDGTEVVLPDGSRIVSQSTYKKSDGSTGISASTVLAAEAEGHKVDQTVSVDGAGNRTLTAKAYGADGEISYILRAVTNAAGTQVTNSYDDDGDGVYDRMQTVTTSVDGAGVKTESRVDRQGSVLSSTLVQGQVDTVTSVDGKTVTVLRDADGGGGDEQREIRQTNADGSRSLTIADLAENGTVLHSRLQTISANGLTRTTKDDFDGDGLYDRTESFAVSNLAGGARTETTTVTNRNGTLREKAIETVTADNRTHTTTFDLDGNTTTDKTVSVVTTAGAAGSSITSTTVLNGDGSLRTSRVQGQSADTLIKTLTQDRDGDGQTDLTTYNATVLNPDGSRAETVTITSNDLSIISMTKVTLGADKVSSETWNDENRDGVFQSTDLARSVTVNATTQARTATSWERNADGSFSRKETVTTSTDGLSITTVLDADGDGDTDLTTTDVTVKNTNGSSTQTITATNQNGSTNRQDVITTTSNGLTVTTISDLDGDGVNDSKVVVTAVNAADNSTTRTTSTYAGNGSTLLGRVTVAQSGDRTQTTTTTDANGDLAADQVVTALENADGSRSVTTQTLFTNGGLAAQSVQSVSANGLVSTTSFDSDGNGTIEQVAIDTKVYASDGSITRTSQVENGDGSLRSQVAVTVSDDGLVTTTRNDMDGNGSYERVRTDSSVLNANGSVTTTTLIKSASGATLSREVTTLSDDGLITTVQSDGDGNGSFDLVSTKTTTLGLDGGTTVADVLRDGAGALRSAVTVISSADGRSVLTQSDVNGDGVTDTLLSRIEDGTGKVTVTTSEFSSAGRLQSLSDQSVTDDGLIKVMRSDFDGNYRYERTVTDTTVRNGDGSTTQTVLEKTQNGTTYRKTVVVTSDDGRSQTITRDLNNDGTVDLTETQTLAIATNGVKTETTQRNAANGQSLSTDTVVTAANQKTVTRTLDSDGNGATDRTTVTTIGIDGLVRVTDTFLSTAGVTIASRITTQSGDGLTQSMAIDRNGDTRSDLTVLSQTVRGSDGSASTQSSYRNEENALLARQEHYASDDGLFKRVTTDIDGDGKVDFVTEGQTVYGTTGDSIQTRVTRDATRDVVSEQMVWTSGNGLIETTTQDYTGNGSPDRISTLTRTADGAWSKVSEHYVGGFARSRAETESQSADGRDHRWSVDLEGDGHIDRQIRTLIDLDRNETSTLGDINADGTTGKSVSTWTSANGAQIVRSFDLGADGTVDLRHETLRSVDNAGNVTTSFREVYGSSAQTYQETTTVSANGLTSTTTYDANGDGTVDGTRQSITTLNTDGSRKISEVTRYADNDLRENIQTTISADGRHKTVLHDYDGNGVFDKALIIDIDVDGTTRRVEKAFDQGGNISQIFTTTTSADGLITTTQRGSGTETITRSVLKNGSYDYWNGVTPATGVTSVKSSHKIDDLGVETWAATLDDGLFPQNFSARLDAEAKARVLAEAERIYDTVLDRGLDSVEAETLVRYVVNGQLDRTTLAATLVASGEFAARYGTMTYPETVTQLYQNSFGRGPSMAELDVHLTENQLGVATAASLARDLAESVEHIALGNGHRATNNFDVIMNPAQFERVLDRAYLEGLVENLVEVAHGRAATQQELSYLTDLLQRDVEKLDDLAGRLLGVSGFLTGSPSNSLINLSNTDLVKQAYLNATGRPPGDGFQEHWIAHLDAGRITKAEFVASLALSAEHLEVSGFHDLRTPPTVTTVNGTAAAEVLQGGSGTDSLSGLGGNDTLNGSDGSDSLSGGTGVDSLNGGNGNDFYIWSLNDGSDTINDAGVSMIEEDTLVLTNVASNGVSLSRAAGSNTLIVTITATGETISVQSQFASTSQGQGIEAIRFADGVAWTFEDIMARAQVNGTGGGDNLGGTDYGDLIKGFGGADTLVGHGGDDTLSGGTSSDMLYGGTGTPQATNGNDNYLWVKTHGNDTIYDLSQSLTEVDTLNLGNVLSNDVALSRANGSNDLVITIVSTGEKITVSQMYQNKAYGYGLERIVFSNSETWNREDIFNKTLLSGTTAAETLTGSTLSDNILGLDGNDVLNGYDGNDTLTGGLGDDTLRGGTNSGEGTNGHDTFIWSKGDGNDWLTDYGQKFTETDRLILTDVASNDVKLGRISGSGDVTLTVLSTGETIVLDSQHNNPAYAYGVEEIRFADGVIWTRDDIDARSKIEGTSGADALTGRDGDDSIAGYGGADTVTGGNGNDSLSGGGGNDSLVGGNGSDRYYWYKLWGNETINDLGSAAGEVDTLHLVDLNRSEVSLSVSGTSLIVTSIPTSETITILNRYHSSGSPYGIEIIQFKDGSLLDISTSPVSQAQVNGTTGADNLSGWNHADLMFGGAGADTLGGNNGNDELTGGTGVDSLVGGNGADTYIWAQGDGNDMINDNVSQISERDVLRLTDTASTGVTLTRTSGGYDLSIRINATAEVLTIRSMFTGTSNSYGIEAIEFSDGVIWELEDILAKTATNGTSGNDNLAGSDYADNLNGFGGNDTLNAGHGDDVLNGGAGVDSLNGGNGHDRYLWSTGEGSDTINDAGTSLTEADKLVFGNVTSTGVTLTRANGSNNMLITVTATGEVLTVVNQFQAATSGTGIEAIAFADGVLWTLDDIQDATTLTGTAANETLNGTTFRDNLNGGGGNDTLVGNTGDDTITGGAGNDLLYGGSNGFVADTDGQDVYRWFKGDGNDIIRDWSRSTIEVDTLDLLDVASTDVSLTRANGNNDLVIRIVSTGETVTLDERYQSINYGYGVERIRFADGVSWTLADILANTAVNGTAAAETLNGTAYDDYLYGLAGNDTINGGAGDDVIIGGAGADVIDGGDGSDTISYATSTAAVTVRTYEGVGYGGDAQGDSFSGIDNLIGSAFNDVLNGGSKSNTLFGLDGNDTIYGLDGADLIDLGNGHDRGNGGEMADTVYGGAGNDSFGGGDGNDLLYAGDGYDTMDGEGGNDTIYGGTGFDSLTGGNGDDWLIGEDGKDTLMGGAGADTLEGGLWNDVLRGEDGADRLIGGVGNDTLDGGTAAGEVDVFVFDLDDGWDMVENFQNGVDKIEFLSGAVTFASLTMSTATDGVQIFYDTGDSFVLKGMTLAQMTVDDFIFV